MTEAEWLACDRVLTPQMNWLRRRGSQRQFYLAGAAWARQVEHVISDKRYRDLIELVERFADGKAVKRELAAAFRAAENDVYERHLLLMNEGHSESAANRRLVGDVAAMRAATPGDGWIAAINSLKEAGRFGRREEMGPRQMEVLRDIFGNPFRPVTLDPRLLSSTVVDLAHTIYDERVWERMPILADALMDAGCDSEEMLIHCRHSAPHVRGCWVVDLLVGNRID